ncbi:MAG TPA: RNA polymerase sigma factor [Candidatus Dormibacteraeota bacterium]
MGAVPNLDPVHHFRELYEREYAAVFRTVRAIVLDAQEAEDVTQEAFVKAYRARDRYQPTAPVGAWLHRIAVNTAISHLRRRRLARLLPVRLYSPNAGGEYDQVEARSVVEHALAELSPKLRAVIALHYYVGLRREEIATALGVPSGTVASRLAKAVSTLRRRLVVDDSDPTQEAPRLLDEGALR